MRIFIHLFLGVIYAQCFSQSWNPVGPSSVVEGLAANGAISCIAFHPTNPRTFWVGTPSSGVWKTTDAGTTWTNSGTDSLATIGVSDILVDPTDSNRIVIASGDRDGRRSYSMLTGFSSTLTGIGAYCSANAGLTWKEATVTANYSSYPRYIANKIAHCKPTASRVLFATNRGVFSMNDDKTITSIVENIYVGVNPNYPDICYKPNDASTFYYTVGDRIGVSRDSGKTTSTFKITAASMLVGRIALAVTELNASLVYAVVSDVNGAFAGLYCSTDEGKNWSLRSATPNVLAESVTADGQVGGGMQCLSLVVSPYNQNLLYVGSVNIWCSTDGGVRWTSVSNARSTRSDFVSADIHDLRFSTSDKNKLYACSGNGLFVSADSARSWKCISQAIVAPQILSVAVHPENDSLVFAATPYGMLQLQNGIWSKRFDSACSHVCFDTRGSSMMYLTTRSGHLLFSRDTMRSVERDISPISTILGSDAQPYHFNPSNSGTVYANLQKLWKTTDRGSNWQEIPNTFGKPIVTLSVSESDSNIIYLATTAHVLWKSSDAGYHWQQQSVVSADAEDITRIIIHPTSPSTICIITDRHVLYSVNGGKTFVDKKFGSSGTVLSGEAVLTSDNCGDKIFLGSNKSLLIYRLTSSTDTTTIPALLPRSSVSSLTLSMDRFVVATEGRGLWILRYTNFGVHPDFVTDIPAPCPGQDITFYNTSMFATDTALWFFEGGLPATSIEQHPTVSFGNGGEHTVRLTVRSNCQKDSSITRKIWVQPRLKAAISSIPNAVCQGDTLHISNLTIENSAQQHWTLTGAYSTNATDRDITVICDSLKPVSLKLIVANGCFSDSLIRNVRVEALPQSAIITTQDDSLLATVIPQVSYQWFRNNEVIPGASQMSFQPHDQGDYKVRTMNAAGCSTFSTSVHFTPTSSSVASDASFADVCIAPQPFADALRISYKTQCCLAISVTLRNMLGQVCLHQILAPDLPEAILNTSQLSPGFYQVEICRDSSVSVFRAMKQ